MIIGYARVSTDQQNLDRQLDQLKNAGCEIIYQEKKTGRTQYRPELDKLLENITEKDLVVITELTRLSRSQKDLFQIVETIEKKGASIKSLKEDWMNTSSCYGKLIFSLFAGISQFERDLISQRTKEGLRFAVERGKKCGRPFKDKNEIDRALEMYQTRKYSVVEINKATGVSRATLYRYVRNT